jgi:gamma-glutamyltranspeptidase/glutathione hydrolase
MELAAVCLLFTRSRVYINHDLAFTSRRSPVYSLAGMVATTQPLAVAAGLKILSEGGNAADAAVATAAALNVTEPTSTGLGGDCFALFYEAATGQITALNGSGRAPAALSLDRLNNEGFQGELPPYHPYTITVPGACAGWCDLVACHGQLALQQILAPAIKLAEEGFPVSSITSHYWNNSAGRLATVAGGIELTINGRAPRPGEIFRNPGLARTLRKIAEGGKTSFYQGEIAQAIANVIQEAGGCLTESDLAAHTSTWERPICTTYRGFRIWECPPNGQGLATLLALNLLEGFDLASLPPLSSQRLHLMIEAMRLAFADTRWYVADQEFNPAPVEQLCSKDYADQRRRLIHPKHATLDQQRGSPTSSSDTVYLCAVDADGNACSFINSNYSGFGTGIVPSGWGFSLQNRGYGFSLDPSHPNALAPGKRPYHTIIPALITLDADPGAKIPNILQASLGVMGGFMQPQGHVQVVVGLVDDQLDSQAALDQLRFCIEDGTAGGQVALEEGIAPLVLSELEALGHQVYTASGYGRSTFGRGQVIWRDPQTGVLCGGSDPRGDGCAMSL